ncbi:MAG: H(+)-transporting V1 sector ATPase subunit H [Piccolia ochrophora]|nr:MAG: H(+)-transporting V1 sector ATPase subunit H [Piccolia ochrophora]
MSLDPPAYLLSIQNNFRARPIPWDAVVRAGHVTEGDISKIRSVDKVKKDQRKQAVEKDLQGFRNLLLGDDGSQSVFETAAKRADVVQYILVLAGDLINDVSTLKSSLLSHPTPFKPFLPLLTQSSNPEDALPLLASSILTTLISGALEASESTREPEAAIPKLYTYLSLLAKSSDSGLQDIAVQEYSTLLRTRRSRELFWRQQSETVSPLIDILGTAAGVAKNGDEASTLWSGSSSVRGTTEGGIGGGVGLQLLYHVLLVFWQLSFEGDLVGDGLEQCASPHPSLTKTYDLMSRTYEFIPLYTQLLRLSPKEKTTRLLLSTLLNLVGTNRNTLLPACALVRLPSLLTNLQGRHLTDPDLLDDLESLTEMLDEYTRTQTTFDEYAAEVRSGHLHWSPPHRNAAFWRENARRIVDESQGELIKKLAEILSKRWEGDKQVLAVGCNDVGCLVKEVPEMRLKLERAGLKTRVMELMAEADETVRWESLRAVGEWMRYSFEG